MKLKTLMPALILLVLPSLVSAQWNIVRETDKMMSYGSRPCFEIEFLDTDDKTVLEVWKDFSKENFGAKAKRDRKSGEYVTEKADANYINSNDFTIYIKLDERRDNVSFSAWFDVGSGFVNSRDYPSEARETGNTLKQFYYAVRRAVIGEEQQEAEKQLSTMESQVSRLERDNENLRKSIEDYKERIKKAEQSIIDNTKKMDATLADIDNQKSAIEQIKLRIKNVENEGQ